MGQVFREPGAQIAIARLTHVEIHSVFAIKVTTGVLTIREAHNLGMQFRAHVSSGRIHVFAVTDETYLQAEELIFRYGFHHRLRSLDAIQLSVAMDLQRQGLIDQLVASDKALCDVAQAEGMLVLNPS